MAGTSAAGLEIGVFFDFDKGKAKGIKELEEYIDRLQHLASKRKLYFTAGIDTGSKTFLNYYNKSVDEINKKIKEISKEWKKLEGTTNGIFDVDGKITNKAMLLAQKYRELIALRKNSAVTLEELNRRIDRQLEQERRALQKLNNEYKKGGGYLKHLIQRMTIYASVGAVVGFLTKIREVTAEFELQRISLGAIIQDQNKANALFAEIKNFALQSPLKILDLTKYTKQLAAYRIETDKLFDTTKRLADVSVGLGVDMQRLILFYGQVRAAGYLRASEVRQATEAGIPLVEELANKLSKANGQLVTAAQVMDMISKRQISFQQVAEVFEDMTNKGGIFYNMQEKQGNTLYGMWQKLGDAVAMMYDEIGNTSVINEGIKGTISLLRTLMINWRDVGRAIFVAGTAFLAFKVNTSILTMVTSRTLLLERAIEREIAAEERLNAAKLSGNKLSILSAKLKLRAAQLSVKAAEATKFWGMQGRGLLKLKSAIASVGATLSAYAPMFALTIGIAAWQWIESGIEKANRLKNALKDIQKESIAEQSKSVQNFESLVLKAVSPASSQKEQREALEELHNTYGKIIPIEDLQIEKLKEMHGNYAILTQAIRENIAEQKRQEGITTILDTYAEKIKKAEDRVKKQLGRGLRFENDTILFNEAQIDRILENYKNKIKEFVERGRIIDETAIGRAMTEALKFEGIYTQIDTNRQLDALMQFNASTLYSLADAYEEQERKLKEWDDSAKKTYATLGRLADLMNEAKNQIDNFDYKNEQGTYSYDEEVSRVTIESYLKQLKQAFAEAGITIDLNDYITFDENGEYSALDWKALLDKITDYTAKFNEDEKKLMAEREAYMKQHEAEINKGKDGDEAKAQEYLGKRMQIDQKLRQLINPEALKNMVAEVQGIFDGIVPKDPVSQKLKSKLETISTTIWGSLDAGMKSMKKYIWDGSKALHLQYKDWQDQLELLEGDIYKYEALVRKFGYSNEELKSKFGVDLENMKNEAKGVQQYMAEARQYIAPSLLQKGKGSGHKSDPRLQLLNNIASTMEKINKEYDDLLKKEGQTKALADTQRLFAEELANMQKIASKHGFKLPAFEVPKSAQDVAKWYKAVADEIRRLNIKDADKILIELGYKEGKVDIDEMQRQLEKKLKELSERISQSKTAKEFYDKILTQTGDVDIAASVTMSIYGDTGEGLFDQTIAQIREVFASGVAGVNIPIDTAFDFTNNVIDYGKLAKIYEQYQDSMVEANKSTAQKIISEGQKTASQNVLTWQKELAKAKDFEEQRTDILNRETQRRAEIIKSNIPQEMKDQLIQLSYDKQAQDLADVNVKEFKASEDYIKIFENLDRVSTNALKRLRTNLAEIIQQNKDLNPENMKQLVKALEQLDSKIEGRGFGNTMIAGIKEYFQSFKKLKEAQTALKQAQAEYAEQELSLNAQIEVAETNHQLAQDNLNNLRASGLATIEQIKEAELRVNDAATAVAKAKEKQAKAAEKVKKAEQRVTDAEDEQLEGAEKFKSDMEKLKQITDQFASALGDVKDLLGLAEDSAAGVAFDSAIEGLNRMSQIYGLIITLQEMYNAVTNSNPWMAIAAAVLTVASILGSWISNEKVRRANKEIERQEKILHNLEYAYDRLEKAQERLFGTEHIQNYNAQLANLEAQTWAYKRQLDAERSKGKKADKDAIQDYEDKWRETMDEIKDMADDLREYITGTDLTSAARDWANSWLEARWSFEDTTEAMKENFADMVQNMIVESMAAKIMENVLTPIYEAIDESMKNGAAPTAEDINNIAELGYNAIGQANIAMEALMAKLQEAGLDLQEMFGEGTDLTGISRDIATASEESINGLAQGINTQNYYISHVPTISENVMAIRMLMEGGAGVNLGEGSDLMSLQNEHLAQLPVIAANTMATAERCERAAIACEAIQSAMESVLDFKGNKRVINTTMY